MLFVLYIILPVLQSQVITFSNPNGRYEALTLCEYQVHHRQTLQLYVLLHLHTLTLRRLMSYIYGAPILDVSRSHTTTQHSR